MIRRSLASFVEDLGRTKFLMTSPWPREQPPRTVLRLASCSPAPSSRSCSRSLPAATTNSSRARSRRPTKKRTAAKRAAAKMTAAERPRAKQIPATPTAARAIATTPASVRPAPARPWLRVHPGAQRLARDRGPADGRHRGHDLRLRVARQLHVSRRRRAAGAQPRRIEILANNPKAVSAWVSVGNGRITASGAPGRARLSQWLAHGATDIVTLQRADEHGAERGRGDRYHRPRASADGRGAAPDREARFTAIARRGAFWRPDRGRKAVAARGARGAAKPRSPTTGAPVAVFDHLWGPAPREVSQAARVAFAVDTPHPGCQ
jgi:hypothetical protein